MEVYFDNSSTTRVYEEVITEITKGLREYYGNPSAVHEAGFKSFKKLEECRQLIADTINCTKEEIYFNSGGSEGNNTVLKGLLKEGNNIITTPFEHASVVKTLEYLNKKGIKIITLKIDKWGKIDLKDLEEKINKNTALVSVMHVNNETGVIQDIEKIGKIIKDNSRRAKFHTDCVQSYGKIPVNVEKMNIDFLTVSAHKIHGPKGTGFMYIRKNLKLNPIIHGGKQELDLRAGTQNVSGIMGMAKAAVIAEKTMKEKYKKLSALKNYFIEKLNELQNVKINSPNNSDFSPYILNVSFKGVRGEVFLHYLESKGIYVSTGSACSSKERAKGKGSYVLRALGLSDEETEGEIRFSFSEDNTLEEIDYASEIIKEGLNFLRKTGI